MRDKCRQAYEQIVQVSIQPEHRDEFLKIGSPHWLDFKNGWLAHERHMKAKANG